MPSEILNTKATTLAEQVEALTATAINELKTANAMTDARKQFYIFFLALQKLIAANQTPGSHYTSNQDTTQRSFSDFVISVAKGEELISNTTSDENSNAETVNIPTKNSNLLFDDGFDCYRKTIKTITTKLAMHNHVLPNTTPTNSSIRTDESSKLTDTTEIERLLIPIKQRQIEYARRLTNHEHQKGFGIFRSGHLVKDKLLATAIIIKKTESLIQKMNNGASLENEDCIFHFGDNPNIIKAAKESGMNRCIFQQRKLGDDYEALKNALATVIDKHNRSIPDLFNNMYENIYSKSWNPSFRSATD